MIAFPTTAEMFIADQERIIGRTLSEKEKAVTAEWVTAFNMSYEDGLERDRAALGDSLAKMDELIAGREGSPALQTCLRASRAWIIEAWKQGAERSANDG